MALVAFWLREGERHGRGEEFEGAPLGGSGDAEGGHDGGAVVAAVADVVAGEGGEVVEQTAEAP